MSTAVEALLSLLCVKRVAEKTIKKVSSSLTCYQQDIGSETQVLVLLCSVFKYLNLKTLRPKRNTLCLLCFSYLYATVMLEQEEGCLGLG